MAAVRHFEFAKFWYHRLRGSAALLQRRRQFPMAKIETLNPCKIETLEQIDTKFVRIDYVNEWNFCLKFGTQVQSVFGRSDT